MVNNILIQSLVSQTLVLSRIVPGSATHLTEELAARLVELVMTRYVEEMGQKPRRVVIHKTSRYWSAEKSGFELLCKSM
jgi:dihydroneopterin aldolase